MAIAGRPAPETPDQTESLRFRLARGQRLRRRGDFDAVFAHGKRVTVGPLSVRGRPNGLALTRIGLAVSRRFGSAVARNAFKRRIREAFRLNQHALPRGYDLVVSAHPHEVEKSMVYERMLAEAADRIVSRCNQRT